MKNYLWEVIKLYLLMMFILTFSSTILSPNFHADSLYGLAKAAFKLFIYRFNIFSIFSLLFATLLAVQNYEKQNVNVALSMSGIHSFKIMRPVFLFSLFLSIFGLLLNQFFLGDALKALGKDSYLSSYNETLYVKHLDTGTLFYKNGYKNFTYINRDKEIFYAPLAEARDGAFHLNSLDHFVKKGNSYVKKESVSHYRLPIDPSCIINESKIKRSKSLWSLIRIALEKSGADQINRDALITSIAYRIALPFLNLFAVALGTILGFSAFFRKKYYTALCLCIFLSLFFFYLLECSAILALAGVISPQIFILIALCLFVFPPYIAYSKKV
jgi:lipopolysaccharide export LptBFGC system permease protein LptF